MSMSDLIDGSAAPVFATVSLPDEAAAQAFGARLGRLLRPGDVVALQGDLGMGKTTLARAAIRAALRDPDAPVPSPTFTLVQTYEAPECAIWHVDLYRLSEPEDAWELGLEEAFGSAATLIEWPERLAAALPSDRLLIALTEQGRGRAARLEAGPPWAERLEELTR
jgi:tRNA threonylcarbamoyladenosine biosynthesis protein TsaE